MLLAELQFVEFNSPRVAAAATYADNATAGDGVKQPRGWFGKAVNPIAKAATGAGVLGAYPAYAVAGAAAVKAKPAAAAARDATIVPVSAVRS